MAETLFQLPNSPSEFGVILPPADLRRINFSALDFSTLRRALVEYVKTYYAGDFNDFVNSNGAVMFMEMVAYVGSIISVHEDVLADEGFLPTAQTRDAVVQHLALINRSLKRQTPAVVDVSVSVSSPVPSSIKIPAATRFTLSGPDGNSLVYEIFRAPGDFTGPIEILPGKQGTIAHGIEGSFAEPQTAISAGGPDQAIEITASDVLDAPITVDVRTGNDTVRWQRIDAIERAMANDEVYEVQFSVDGMTILFGDDNHGKAPLAGQVITISYRTGGGIRGRIGANFINTSRAVSPEPPSSAPVDILFRNLTPSSGGEDEESIDIAKRVAPKEAATMQAATTGEDYAVLAKNFRSPIYGSVLKAVAGIKTSINANVVELYVLAEGIDGPVLPSSGLKTGLAAFFSDIQVLTDEIRVIDGGIKAVDVKMDVIINRNADPNIVKDKVNSAIDDFFDFNKRDMGDPLFRSRLISLISSIDGVQMVNLYEPSVNILRSDTTTDGVGVLFSELIVLGQKNISFYFEA